MDYFNTHWSQMTLHDWIGLSVTVIIFGLMIWAYVYTFHPKNKNKFESQAQLPLDADLDAEDAKS